MEFRAGLLTEAVMSGRLKATPNEAEPEIMLPLETVLAADAQTLNQSLVAFRAAILQILEQSAALGNHNEQTALGMMILFVPLQMLSE